MSTLRILFSTAQFDDFEPLCLEANQMKRTILTPSTLTMIALLASTWPDIRRYWRMLTM